MAENSEKGDGIVKTMVRKHFIITFCMHFLRIFFSLHFLWLLAPCLDTVWHLWHLTIPDELLSFHSFLYRFFFILVPSFLKQLLQLTWLVLCFPESHLFPPATPLLSLLTSSSCLLLGICECRLLSSPPLSYSFSVVILGGHFYFLWLPTMQRNF